MDKIHGVCNNPYRNYSKQEKKICEDKERAAGPDGEIGDPINITEMIENFRSGGQQTSYQGMTVNQNLWEASLILLDQYPLDIVDSQGGFISTDWIIKRENPNQRCLIKVNVTSQELLSNGVKVKLLCEQKELDVWYGDKYDVLLLLFLQKFGRFLWRGKYFEETAETYGTNMETVRKHV